jgi:uncharacterized BrkB/YihY/UPF0761 family membrane protein
MWDMVIETFYTASAAVVVTIVQLVADHFLQRRESVSLWRHTWCLALVLGAMFCWIRWGIWWLHRVVPFNYDERVDWLVAMALAAGIGLTISRWRWSH